MRADGTVDGAATAVKVSCSLVVPRDLAREPFRTPVTVRVTIQDVTLADASSTTVAETTTQASTPSDLGGPYELYTELEAGHQYALYAHVDRSGDGTVTVGDLINTARIPIRPTAGTEIHVEVPVREVD